MSDAQAALDAMAHAEIEAKRYADPSDARKIAEWARDRVALVARDRATLERHSPDEEFPMWCGDGGCGELKVDWPCADARAVIDYWTRDA